MTMITRFFRIQSIFAQSFAHIQIQSDARKNEEEMKKHFVYNTSIECCCFFFEENSSH